MMFPALAEALASAFTVHADFAERGDCIKVFARDEYEPDGCDKCVDLVDDDALATAQKAAYLRVVPADRFLYVVAPRTVQRHAQCGFNTDGGSHGSMFRNRRCVHLRDALLNLFAVRAQTFAKDFDCGA
jgi:hypothetical protein